MLKPNLDYRANPNRAIYIQGRIDQQLIDKLTPQIVNLQHQSRAPITVYIDSPGGSTASAEALATLLSVSDQDYSAACRLVTVVTGRAASAAADLLCYGAYAMAFPDSVILFHGVRSLLDSPITVTAASEIMESLRARNERYALALAEKSLSRIGFRYISQRSKFGEYRQKTGKPTLAELFCFLEIIQEHLSPSASKVVGRALERNVRYMALVDHVAKRLRTSKRFQNTKRIADSEAEIIKAIVEYELKTNKDRGWQFSTGGLGQLRFDFLLVREYLNIVDNSHFARLCDLFGDFLLTEDERTQLSVIREGERRKQILDDRVKPILRPLWLFFIALCYVLQEGENELSASDAFWLGLIDEVIGKEDLMPERITLEATPEPSAKPLSCDQTADQAPHLIPETEHPSVT